MYQIISESLTLVGEGSPRSVARLLLRRPYRTLLSAVMPTPLPVSVFHSGAYPPAGRGKNLWSSSLWQAGGFCNTPTAWRWKRGEILKGLFSRHNRQSEQQVSRLASRNASSALLTGSKAPFTPASSDKRSRAAKAGTYGRRGGMFTSFTRRAALISESRLGRNNGLFNIGQSALKCFTGGFP